MTPTDPGSAGTLSVAITGDISGLLQTLQQAQQVATEAGEKITAALSGAGSSYDFGSQLGAQLDEVKQALNGLISVTGEVAPQAHDAEAAERSFAEGLAELGKGAAVAGFALKELTEWMVEIATEATDIYGKVQLATVALTSLTGSAQAADEVLEKMKELSMSTIFDFPELAHTAQQMAVLGVSAEKIPGAMFAISSAAELTGNSLQGVASALERVYSSGDLSTRGLKTLGITLQDLADQMNISSDKIKEAFKGLGPASEDALNILVATVAKKTAEAAEAIEGTLPVAMNRLKQEWDETMIDIGKALAPIKIEALNALESLIPIVNELVEAFKELTPAEQNAVVALGGTVALAGPLAIAFGAFTFAIGEIMEGVPKIASAFAEVFPEAEAFAEVLGVGELAAAALEVALTGLGVVVIALQFKETIADFKNLWETVTEVVGPLDQLTATLTAVADKFSSLKVLVEPFRTLWKGLVQEFKDTPWYDMIVTPLSLTDQGLKVLTAGIQALTGVVPGMRDQVKELGTQTGIFVDEETKAAIASALHADKMAHLSELLKEYGISLDTVTPKLKEAKDKFKDVSDELDAAGGTLEKMLLKLPDTLSAVGDKIDKAITFDKFEKGLIDFNEVVQKEVTAATKPIDDFITSLQHSAAGMTENGQNLIKMAEDMREGIRKFVNDRAFQDLQKVTDDYAAASEIDAQRIQDANVDILTNIQAIALAARNTDMVFQNLFDPAVQAAVKLSEAYKTLKIDVGTGLTDAAAKAVSAFDVILTDGSLTVDRLDAGFEKVFQSLTRLKTSDAMQTLATEAQKALDAMQRMNAPLSDQLALQQKILQAEISVAEARGASGKAVLQLTMQLEDVRLKQDALKIQTQGLSDLFVGVVHALGNAWDQMSKGIADAIVTGQNFGQVMQDVLKKLETSVVELAVKFFTDQLKASIEANIESLGGFGKLFEKLFGKVAETGKAATEATKGSEGVVQQALIQVGSQIAQMVTMLGSVVTAISSIIGNFQMAHMNKVLGEIEQNTRYTFMSLSGGDGLVFWAKQSGQVLTDINNWNHDFMQNILVTMSSDLDGIAGTLVKILDVVAAGGMSGTSDFSSSSSGQGFKGTATMFSDSLRAMNNAVTDFTPNADDFSTAVQKAADFTNSYSQTLADANQRSMASKTPDIGAMVTSADRQMTDAEKTMVADALKGWTAPMAGASSGNGNQFIAGFGSTAIPTPYTPPAGAMSTGVYVNTQGGSAAWSPSGQPQGVSIYVTGNAITSQDSAQRLAQTMVAQLRNNAGLKLG